VAAASVGRGAAESTPVVSGDGEGQPVAAVGNRAGPSLEEVSATEVLRGDKKGSMSGMFVALFSAGCLVGVVAAWLVMRRAGSSGRGTRASEDWREGGD
ncbi:unnamed protein product, partial [marine sediment metagenome]